VTDTRLAEAVVCVLLLGLALLLAMTIGAPARRHEGVLVERPGWLDHHVGDRPVVLAGPRPGICQLGPAVVAGEDGQLSGLQEQQLSENAFDIISCSSSSRDCRWPNRPKLLARLASMV
jgi:hypothetical protein